MTAASTKRPPRRWAAADDEAVRAGHAAGLPDKYIAAGIGCGPRTVARCRRRLGLPKLYRRGSDWLRATPEGRAAQDAHLRQIHRRTLDAAGAGSLTEIRVRQRRELATRYGLPEDLGPREVTIVLALAAGPMTKADLLRALNMPVPRRGAQFAFGCTGNRQNTRLGDLAARGLVVQYRRKGPRGHAAPSLYMLTAEAMARLAAAGDAHATAD